MRKLSSIIVVLLTFFLLLIPTSCTVTAPLEKYEETQNMMDTFVRVTIYSEDKALAEKAIQSAFTRM